MKATYTNSTAAFSAEPTKRRASRFCGRSVMGRAVKASGSGVNVPFAPLPSRQAAWRIRQDGINFGSGAKDTAVAAAPQSAARERMDHGSRKTPPR